MLKQDWKQNIILLIFSFLMIEILTTSTLLFVVGGLLLVSFGIKTNKLLRNILAIGVFASYWLKYGKIIDPEVGINFLTSIIVLKILEKETVRDRYMIFFGLILLISAGSLFEKTLTYVLFFGVSFMILIRDFYSYIGQKWRLKDLGYAIVWVLPFTFVLFFFVPRLLNPIPFQQGGTSPGELGYTPDVNISQIESLSGNQAPVFQVIVSKPLNMGELYWRGNTLSFNDGWNWTKMGQDTEEAEYLLGAGPSSVEVKQTFRLFGKQDYFFALDFPRVIFSNKDILGLKNLRTLPQRRWQWVPRYEAISGPNQEIKEDSPGEGYLQVPLSKKQKVEISNKFPGTTVEEVRRSIRAHFIKERFSYSLSPGRSTTLNEFLERKIGFCSHYASATALIMRVKGIPTRLVSGFMGGSYNRFADFYLISENDAHVWVEAWSAGEWKRLDPTEWIAPDRVRLGGEAYMENVSGGVFAKNRFFRPPRFFQDLKLWFGQWDFLFYQWLEQMDYHTQEAFFSRFKFKRQWLFSIIPLMMVVFMILYSWYLSRRKRNTDESEFHELWRSFFSKMKKRGLSLSNQSVMSSENALQALNDQEVLNVWNELKNASFGRDTYSIKEIKRKIRKL